jgi:twitching motility two-component system response regulator PilH
MLNVKRILIVDDSDVEREIIKNILQDYKFEIHEARNATEGITKAEEISPDLILMDVVMPGMNGFQATKIITSKPNLSNIPVIMCTSRNKSGDKIWGQKQGAKAYILKPIKENKESLLVEINKYLNV